VTQISTDGFAAYPEAVDLAFGPYVKFGTIIKDYRNADRPPGNYSPAQIVSADRCPRFGMREDEARTICTSHVERNNLTTRTFMKRFARLSLGFSKKCEILAAAAALHFANYNFCWRPRYQDWSGKAGQLRPTPAMMAGVTNRLWKFDDLFSEVSARYLNR
jgi:IS1 transposase